MMPFPAMPFVLVVLTTVLSVLRLMGHTSSAFQAAAHVYVGILLGGWWLTPHFDTDKPWFKWNAILITVVELIAAAPKIIVLFNA